MEAAERLKRWIDKSEDDELKAEMVELWQAYEAELAAAEEAEQEGSDEDAQHDADQSSHETSAAASSIIFPALVNNSGDGEATKAIKRLYTESLEFSHSRVLAPYGAGPLCLNRHSVARIAQAIASWIRDTFTEPHVVLGRDTHAHGDELIRTIAQVLGAHGISCTIFAEPCPLAELSFAVSELNGAAAVYVGSGRGGAQSSGITVLGPDGAELDAVAEDRICTVLETTDEFDDIRLASFDSALEFGRIRWADEKLEERYLDALTAAVPHHDETNPRVELAVVYTPLAGACHELFTKLIERNEGDSLMLVNAQLPDEGAFEHCVIPAPDDPDTMVVALEACEGHVADILIATSPDGSELGVAIPDRGRWRMLSASELTVLLLDYVISSRELAGSMPERPVVLASIVSAPMSEIICEEHAVRLKRTQPGFAHIGRILTRLADRDQMQRFLLGIDEAGRMLVGTHARVSDALAVANMVLEMVRSYKTAATSMTEQLEWLGYHNGYYGEKTLSIPFEGPHGRGERLRMMDSLREAPPKTFAGMEVESVIDYRERKGDLPASDALRIRLEDGSVVLICPAASEMALKVHLFARGYSEERADERAAALERAARFLLAGRMGPEFE